ncbi:MAG: acetate--CoA ligase [Pseudomonadota bacterium]
MIHIKTQADHDKYTKMAKSDRDGFWREASSSFFWRKAPKLVSQGKLGEKVTWFEDSVLNLSENCLDRHMASKADQVALIWEPNSPDDPSRSFTFRELKREVEVFANTLKKLGVKKGDRVVIYMAMIPELMFSVLACARLGAVHCVVFAGFSAKSLSARIEDSGSDFIIISSGAARGAKCIPLKGIVDEALMMSPRVQTCLVIKHTEEPLSMNVPRDVWYHEASHGVSDSCEAVSVGGEDPLFILYTSGSTGKPKGLLHTTAGYMVYAEYTFRNVFQMQQGDLFWCTADLGWITGHTYLTYGPLLSGATTLMFEGIPTWPDASRFWRVIDRHQVTHFYTAPTAIRTLEAFGLSPFTGRSLDSLKVLGSVGEPINEEAWQWYFENVGRSRVPIVDTWWQTETGGIMISTLAGVTPAIPTFATLPLPGVEPVLLNSDGKEVTTKAGEGALCIKEPWPGMARTVFGDWQRYQDTYLKAYPGYYFTGDGSKRDDQGNYRITGRIDDIIIVSGHNIGTAEVEDALDLHPSVVESAVVGYSHPVKGQGIHGFLICSDPNVDRDKLKSELLTLVTRELGPIAKPERFQVVAGLPKTRSGKIMRRILRKIAEAETKDFGDISTLLNPEIVDQILKAEIF